MKKYHLILISLFLSFSLFAQDRSPIAKKVQETKSILNQEFDLIENILIPNKSISISNSNLKDTESGTYFDYNKNIYKQLSENSKSAIALQIPYEHEEGTHLILDLMEVSGSFYDYILTTSSGSKYNGHSEKGVHYRGIVRGKELLSLVAVSVFENEIMGIVSIRGEGTINIGKLPKQDIHIMYNDANQKSLDDVDCILLEHSQNEVLNDLYSNIESLPSDAVVDECVHIYFEVDHQIYQHFGSSIANTENFVAGLFNQVATLYMNENITLEISEIFIWDTPDSYSTGILNGLFDFEAVRTTFNGDLAHLLSFNTENTDPILNAGGVAYLGTLCGGSPYGHTRLFPEFEVFPTFSRQVKVVTHELGHNLGSNHTQACVWNGNCTAIDGCAPPESRAPCNTLCTQPALPPANTGTIMSYCDRNVGIDFTLGFGQQPGDIIRNFIANASCLSPCSNCPDNITHSGTINSGDYEASNSIVSTATIGSNQNVIYDAGNFICLNPNFIADASNGSVFFAVIDGCGGFYKVEQDNSITENPVIFKNYPNPFTGQTTIEFTLVEDTNVTLFVSDAMGRQIATLLQYESKSEGAHHIIFDGKDYPAGMYYYTIRAGEYVGTQKMVLVK